MLSWDDFRYVKAIADTRRSRVRPSCSASTIPRSFAASSRSSSNSPAPVRARPRQLCAHRLRRAHDRASRAHGGEHRLLRAYSHRAGLAAVGRVAGDHQRRGTAASAERDTDRLRPRLSGDRARYRGLEPAAQSVQARRRRGGADDRPQSRPAPGQDRAHRVGGIRRPRSQGSHSTPRSMQAATTGSRSTIPSRPARQRNGSTSTPAGSASSTR